MVGTGRRRSCADQQAGPSRGPAMCRGAGARIKSPLGLLATAKQNTATQPLESVEFQGFGEVRDGASDDLSLHHSSGGAGEHRRRARCCELDWTGLDVEVDGSDGNAR